MTKNISMSKVFDNFDEPGEPFTLSAKEIYWEAV